MSSIKIDIREECPREHTLGKGCLAGRWRQSRAGIEGRALRLFRSKYPWEWQSIVDAEAATNGSLTISEQVISKTDSRFEIAQCGIAIEEFLDADERSAGGQHS